ncbi:hypothetical protein FA09DRAFT_85749 [Tilletiopsis washingtonensis]|uniref:Uncharacterized protein n=1 Tax=Tilletiopsis washingtonensis TaxID=58919 RepID=A0A316Z732_9BASI|nr:hypothetical protein FA09DRAFT_85749 [Tilletiopsis washingtonensis]PWN96778.1 hypothetical protein FA09DRAFT_85749 [Tilletiopsis washingtonensis]
MSFDCARDAIPQSAAMAASCAVGAVWARMRIRARHSTHRQARTAARDASLDIHRGAATRSICASIRFSSHT